MIAEMTLALSFTLYATTAGGTVIKDSKIAGLCDQAAAIAAQSTNVPLDVLRAISRVETGRSGNNGLQPWPWTVNMEGAGKWFATLDEARSYVFQNFKRGARSFDIGCFQINYKWHGENFRSIDDMFDPTSNAKYAAGYLEQLFREFGNWTDAVGAYHSRTPELAKKYTTRFDRIISTLPDGIGQTASGQSGERPVLVSDGRTSASVTSSRPLVAGGTIALGSLVPVTRQPGATVRPFVILK